MFKGDGSARIGSFQNACQAVTTEMPLENGGILEYSAPEMLLSSAFNDTPGHAVEPLGYSYPVDVWALGITTYTSLVGRIPFASDDNEQLFHQILFTEPEYPHDMDPKARAFIAQCLRKRPLDRPAIYDLLTEPFIRDNLNWEDQAAVAPHTLHCNRDAPQESTQVRIGCCKY
jgi:serine/threonine protein kinase